MRQLQAQSHEQEKLLQSERTAKENEAKQMAKMIDEIKKQEEDEKRRSMLVKLKYREDLKKQMEFAKYLKVLKESLLLLVFSKVVSFILGKSRI
jgi:hypothetical protein